MNLVLNERYLFAGFMLDLVAGRFFADGVEVQLRPKCFALLSHLVRNAGRVVSKDELMTVVWPDVTVTEDSLTQCVRDVRRALRGGVAADCAASGVSVRSPARCLGLAARRACLVSGWARYRSR